MWILKKCGNGMTKYLSKMHLRSNHDKKISEQKKNIKQKTKQKKYKKGVKIKSLCTFSHFKVRSTVT